MIIKEGFIGRRRDGEKIGPITVSDIDGFRYTYKSDGSYLKEYASPLDIITEWTDEPTGPVRTVTRKEIVPGTYGYVTTSGPNDAGVRITFPAARLNATEIRAAAATLTEIADALGEQVNERAAK